VVLDLNSFNLMVMGGRQGEGGKVGRDGRRKGGREGERER